MHLAEPERLASSMFAFLRAGLWSGDYCAAVVDGRTATWLRRALVHDLRAAPGRLRLDTVGRSVLDVAAGDRSETFRAWDSIVLHARDEGHPFVRLAVTPQSETYRTPVAPSLVGYEVELHAWTQSHDDVAMVCWYDLSRFAVDTVDDLATLHHGVVLDGQVYEHPIVLGDATVGSPPASTPVPVNHQNHCPGAPSRVRPERSPAAWPSTSVRVWPRAHRRPD